MDSAMSMSALVTVLLDLQHQLRDLPRPLLIGGGFGLYLRQRHLEDVYPERTLVPSELWPPARTTEDVDLFLPTEIVVSTDHMRSIRKALDHLGYESTVRHFQFVKHTPVGPVRIDLLTCDIPTELTNLVRMRSMRVRPTGARIADPPRTAIAAGVRTRCTSTAATGVAASTAGPPAPGTVRAVRTSSTNADADAAAWGRGRGWSRSRSRSFGRRCRPQRSVFARPRARRMSAICPRWTPSCAVIAYVANLPT